MRQNTALEQKDVEMSSLKSQRYETERQHNIQLMQLQFEVTCKLKIISSILCISRSANRSATANNVFVFVTSPAR